MAGLDIERIVELHKEWMEINRKIDELRFVLHSLTVPGVVSPERRKIFPLEHASPQVTRFQLARKIEQRKEFEANLIRQGGEELLKKVTDRATLFRAYQRWLKVEKPIKLKEITKIYEAKYGLGGTPWWNPELIKVLQKYSDRTNDLLRLVIYFKEIEIQDRFEYSFSTIKTTVKPIAKLYFVQLTNNVTGEFRFFLTLQDLVQEMFSRWVVEHKPLGKDWYKLIPRKWEGDIWYRKWRKFMREFLITGTGEPEWEVYPHYRLDKIVGYGKLGIDKIVAMRSDRMRRYWAAVISHMWAWKEWIKQQRPYDFLIPYADDWKVRKIPWYFFYENPRTCITWEEAELADAIIRRKGFTLPKTKPKKEKDITYYFIQAKNLMIDDYLVDIRKRLESLKIQNAGSVVYILRDCLDHIVKKYLEKAKVIRYAWARPYVIYSHAVIAMGFNKLNRLRHYVKDIIRLIVEAEQNKMSTKDILENIISNLMQAGNLIENKIIKDKIRRRAQHLRIPQK